MSTTTVVTQRRSAFPTVIKPKVTAEQIINPTAGTISKATKESFTWTYSDEPHATRRKLILAKYPQIAELFTNEPLTFWIVCLEFTIQVTMAYMMREANWLTIALLAYIVGGTINHSLQLAVHELSHNLCFKSATANKMTGIFANLVTGFPSAITFQRYHMDHHQYQGVDGIDTDIPSDLERRMITNPLTKTIWLFCQPLMYAFRPMFIKPKPSGRWEAMNWIAQVAFDFAIFTFFGTKSFSYLIMGTLLGLGLHPSAGHFVAEHYEFVSGQETYSYYGPFNYVNFNVGYHNEHHDFPRVPWSALPKIKAIAPEFYDSLPCYTSYLYVFYRFICDPEIGCWSRIKRKGKEETLRVMEQSASQDAASFRYFRAVCIGGMATAILAVTASALVGW